MAAGVTCKTCGRRVESCPECGGELQTHTVNINEAGNVVNAMQALVIQDGTQRRIPASAMQRTPDGRHQIHNVDNLFIAQSVIHVNIDNNSSASLSVATDPGDLLYASDDVLLIKTEWQHSNAERSSTPDDASMTRDDGTPDNDTSAGSTATTDEQTQNLVMRIISQKTQTLFDEIMREIQKDELPERFVRELLSQFNVKLVGLTKRLEFYLNVRHGDLSRVMSLEKDIKLFIADLLLPQHARGEVQFEPTLTVSVQCSEKMENRDQRPEGQRPEVLHTEENLFVETPLFKKALDAVQRHGAVVITGKAGTGKTTVGLAILNFYEKKGHETRVVKSTKELRKLREPGFDPCKPVVLCDEASDSELNNQLDIFKAAVEKGFYCVVTLPDNDYWKRPLIKLNTPTMIFLVLDTGTCQLELIDEAETHVQRCKAVHTLLIHRNHGNSATYLVCRSTTPTPSQSRRLTLLGMTPLHSAVQYNTTRLIGLLLQKGITTETRDEDGRTPMHFANSLTTAQIMLDAGAKADAQSNDGRTPLHMAVQHDRASLIEPLLHTGVDINARDEDGRTPLHLAGSQTCAQILLNAGAKANAQSNDGRTLLHEAVFKNRTKLVTFLLHTRVDMNISDEHGWTPLHHAARGETLTSAQMLLEAGAKADVQNNDGHTPLHIATQLDRTSIIELFLNRGVDTGARDEDKKGPKFPKTGILEWLQPKKKKK